MAILLIILYFIIGIICSVLLIQSVKCGEPDFADYMVGGMTTLFWPLGIIVGIFYLIGRIPMFILKKIRS